MKTLKILQCKQSVDNRRRLEAQFLVAFLQQLYFVASTNLKLLSNTIAYYEELLDRRNDEWISNWKQN